MQTEKPEQDKEIILVGREVEVHQMMVDQVLKQFSLLEKHLDKFCKDTKQTGIPFAYVVASMEEMRRGLQQSIENKKAAANVKIQAILDGKDTSERIPLQGEALYPNEETITKGEQLGNDLNIPIGVDPEEKGATND